MSASHPRTPARHILVHNQVNGDGMFQFQYEVDVDRYFWSYQKAQAWASRGDAHACDLPGRQMQLRFIGNEIALYGLCGPDQGIAACRVDGASWQEIDTYALEAGRSVLFHTDGLSDGAHTLTLRVTGKRNPSAAQCSIHMDYADIVQQPECSLSAVSAAQEQLELPPDGGSVLKVIYSSGWKKETACRGAIGGCRYAASAEGGTIDITFEGRQLEIYGDKQAHHGKMRCKADDTPETTITLSQCDGFHPLLYRTPCMPEGTHAVRIIAERDGNNDVIAAIDAFSVTTSAAPALDIRLRPDVRHQTIEGFGASSGWTIDRVCASWREENKNKLADYLYSYDLGIGLTHFRFDLGAGSRKTDRERMKDDFAWRSTDAFLNAEQDQINTDAQPGQQWMMKAAQDRGVISFTAYVHTPPVWMTKNGHGQCDPDTGSTNLQPGRERDFAEYLMRILEHFSAMGLPFDMISPINEPGWKWEYPGVHEEGCRMNAEDIKRVIAAVDQAIKEHNLSVRQLAPEMETLMALTKILPILYADPAIKRALGGDVSAHSYFTDMFDTVGCAARAELRKALDAHGSPRYWQTEYCLMGKGRGEGRDYGIMPALWLAQTVHYDLTILNAVSWQWWLSLSTGDFVWKDGLLYTDWKRPGDEENVIPSKMLWGLGHFSRFIRPGAVRMGIDNAGGDAQVLVSAYKDPRTAQCCLVAINLASFEKRLHIGCAHSALSVKSVYLTDDGSSNLAPANSLWQPDQTLTLPPRAILTLLFDMRATQNE